MTDFSRTFGNADVDEAERERRIRRVFEAVANRYDLMNDLMSFGIHRLWKRTLVRLAVPADGQRIVDLDAGPRLNYWVVLNDQRVQYSGTAKPAVLTLTADTATRLAGKLTLDGTAGGPKVEIEFDAPLLKELKKAR